MTFDIVKLFKAETDGYDGHHNDRIEHCVFSVKIAIPSGVVFEGRVSFNVTYSVGAEAKGEGNFKPVETEQRRAR